jgi:hypothetical protein
MIWRRASLAARLSFEAKFTSSSGSGICIEMGESFGL